MRFWLVTVPPAMSIGGAPRTQPQSEGMRFAKAAAHPVTLILLVDLRHMACVRERHIVPQDFSRSRVGY